jgi:putative DNA primase/helicase
VPNSDLDHLRTELRGSIESLARHLLGKPNRALSSRRGLRWGGKGSLSLPLSGPKLGAWYDHEAGTGGDALALVQHARRCSFLDAVAWARAWLGTPEPERHRAPPAACPRLAEQKQDDAAQAAAERADKVAVAQRIAAAAVPLPGTPGEYYFKQVRGIPRPAAGWPDALRWHPRHRAVLAVSTTPDGTVQAVQRIHLDTEGGKVGAEEMQRRQLKAVKITNGPQDGAAVRLPGDPAGPLLLAEGIETGMAAHASTGHETWIALGPIPKLTPPAGRRVVVLSDDNPPAHVPKHGAAAKALNKALREWRQAGFDLVVATPWPQRRRDKSDMADVMLAEGAGAVAARIAFALGAGRSAVQRVPIRDARDDLKARLQEFTGRAASSAEPFADAVRVDTGSGKSREARLQGVALMRWLREQGDDRTIVFAVEHHKLARAYAEQLRLMAPDLAAAVWLGREAPDPNAQPGAAMCRDLDVIRDVRAAHLDPERFACGPCDKRDGCAYQRQRRRRADFWIVTHEMLTHARPAALGTPAAVFVDENPLDAFLVGAATPQAGSVAEGGDRPLLLSLDALDRAASIEGDLLATDRLQSLRSRVMAVLRQSDDGPVLRGALIVAGLTSEAMQEAGALEWRTKAEPAFTPGMPCELRRDAIRALVANRDLGRRALWWGAVAALLADDGPEASGWASLATVQGDAGPQRVLQLRQRRAVAKGWDAPTIIMDATADAELLRYVWPGLHLVADIRVAAPHQRIRQVVDRAYSLSMLDAGSARDPKEAQRRRNRLGDVHAVIAREARRFAPGLVLVVAQKAVRGALEGMATLPANVEWAHHGALTGLDDWKAARAVIGIGRTMPRPAAVEAQAEALTGAAVPPLAGWYPRRDAAREMADGSLVAAEADWHPHPVAEAFRWQACEARLVQMIGRPRGGDRGPDKPVDILLLTDVPLDLPVTELLTAADIKPSALDRMLAAGGVALLNPRDAHAAYDGMWPSWEMAKKAIAQKQEGNFPYKDPIGEIPLLVRVRYQVAGERRQRVEALVDLAAVPDPRAWLTDKLGDLAEFELLYAPPAAVLPALDTCRDSSKALSPPMPAHLPGIQPALRPQTGLPDP